MADDIVTRLRVMAYQYGLLKERGMSDVDADSISEAADEIERLRAEVEVTAKALRLVCDDASDFQASDQMSFDEHIDRLVKEYIDEARHGEY